MASSDRTEREGVFAVGLFAEQAGWAFRELPRPDRGVDAQIERRTEGWPDGRLIGLQIKSGASQFKNPIPSGWRFYLAASHVQYWRRYRMPVLLVLYDPRIETAYWQLVNGDTTVATGDGFAVDVPSSNVFDARCVQDLDEVSEVPPAMDDAPSDGLVDRRDVLDLPWMWMLHDGERLFLEVEERLNPQDGRCVLRLVAEDAPGEPTTVRTWPRTFLPRRTLAEELAELFPWADKTVDIPYYRQRRVADFLVENGHWEPEEGTYRLDADFDEWLEARIKSGLAPYATSSDESTAFWRLELRLNARGNDAVAQDKREMWDDAHEDLIAADQGELSRVAGWYELRSIEQTYSRDPYLDHLVFVYGRDDDDGMEEIESLLIEPRLFDDGGQPTPGLVDAILRHARGERATSGIHKAFCQRFAAEFDADDGIPTIPFAEIAAWFLELAGIGG